MLPRHRRLDRSAFHVVKLSRFLVRSKFAVLKFTPAPPPGRFSVVTPKSLQINVVARNAIRRRLYSALEGVSVGLWGIIYQQAEIPKNTSAKRVIQDLLDLARKHPKVVPPKKQS